MAYNTEPDTQKKIKGTPFANGLFFGIFLGIVVAIIITLLVTNGKSPFVSKETEGSCIEVNSALGDEDIINIDEDANIETYAESSNEEQNITPDNDRNVLYFIQVGAFSEKKSAINLKARLALMGYESVIMTAEIGLNTFYRVSVGPYKNYDDAKTNREKLFLDGFKANLIKLTSPKEN
ncbi:MAG: SPOR domain-containing protein [Nitrosomonadales bacterium]|jgi:cell division protein FtsN|nr:SPOR domain-containing protein [Nitrosomonadales bacterium]MBT3918028.1 SPOR domain-containing protein [Nitrosomonadales bacterium]MBT4182898.1 SPOR domain-containing protein [Nitrosomonadales bacterium]MBT4571230.1 SPOR domain-containing protein [Nitrosomonadales bacterium]MBT4759040.1 SPOR domain-containing protein [Nitrosomonadales bacterium]